MQKYTSKYYTKLTSDKKYLKINKSAQVAGQMCTGTYAPNGVSMLTWNTRVKPQHSLGTIPGTEAFSFLHNNLMRM